MGKHVMIKQCCFVAAAVIAASMIPASASAQPGSRICGYTTAAADGPLGMVYEAREADTNYSTKCDTAISQIWSAIQSDTKLKALTWVKRRKETCEAVGAPFKSANLSSSDICDKMTANEAYKVVKSNAVNSTSFAKLPADALGTGI